MVPCGPFRSSETFASLLHWTPSPQVSPIAEAPNARDSAIGNIRSRTTLWRRAKLARFCMWRASIKLPIEANVFSRLGKLGNRTDPALPDI
jgi:hypothetical protein